jgi:hypothetical protein
MKKFSCVSAFSVVALLLSVGISLNAQQNTPSSSQPTDPTAQQPASQQPAEPPQGSSSQMPQPRQTPDTTPQAAPTTDSQTFSGTIVKSGEKYMLQDEASGNTYDIDHQAQVKQYEGKKVRVRGTLDPSGKMIHVQ